MSLNPFVIDCDTGRDDALGIWICLNRGLPLKALVSSYGNTVLDNVVENNRRVLGLADAEKQVAIYKGRDAPLHDHKAHHDIVLPRQQISGNGLCNIDLPEPPQALLPSDLDHFVENTLNNVEKLDYIITGPATNFAALLQSLGTTLTDKLGSVTMMGGKLSPFWEELPGADFNLACDPAAIQEIFDHGIPIRFVPMNATWPMALTLEEIEALEPAGAIAETSKALMIAHCKHFAPEPVFRFHDPAVIIACLNPQGFEPARLHIELNEDSPDYGRLLPNDNGNPAFIFNPTNADRAVFLQQMLDYLGLKRDLGLNRQTIQPVRQSNGY